MHRAPYAQTPNPDPCPLRVETWCAHPHNHQPSRHSQHQRFAGCSIGVESPPPSVLRPKLTDSSSIIKHKGHSPQAGAWGLCPYAGVHSLQPPIMRHTTSQQPSNAATAPANQKGKPGARKESHAPNLPYRCTWGPCNPTPAPKNSTTGPLPPTRTLPPPNESPAPCPPTWGSALPIVETTRHPKRRGKRQASPRAPT